MAPPKGFNPKLFRLGIRWSFFLLEISNTKLCIHVWSVGIHLYIETGRPNFLFWSKTRYNVDFLFDFGRSRAVAGRQLRLTWISLLFRGWNFTKHLIKSSKNKKSKNKKKGNGVGWWGHRVHSDSSESAWGKISRVKKIHMALKFSQIWSVTVCVYTV